MAFFTLMERNTRVMYLQDISGQIWRQYCCSLQQGMTYSPCRHTITYIDFNSFFVFRHFKWPYCMKLVNHPDEQNRTLIETTMKAWQVEAKQFLKDLGSEIGLEVDKSQEKHLDVYLISNPENCPFQHF